MTNPTMHLEHEDGSYWTFGELDEAIRDAREHDKLWPIDARFFDLAIGQDGVYVLDNCQAWHQLVDDVVVVWDD